MGTYYRTDSGCDSALDTAVLTLAEMVVPVIGLDELALNLSQQIKLTGVRSRLSSSVAEAAASNKSSHRFPGSSDPAFRPPLSLFSSFDRCLSCFGLRAFSARDDFRGRLGLCLGKGCRLPPLDAEVGGKSAGRRLLRVGSVRDV